MYINHEKHHLKAKEENNSPFLFVSKGKNEISSFNKINMWEQFLNNCEVKCSESIMQMSEFGLNCGGKFENGACKSCEFDKSRTVGCIRPIWHIQTSKVLVALFVVQNLPV